MSNIIVVPVDPEEEKMYGKLFWVCVDGKRTGYPLTRVAAYQKKQRLESTPAEDHDSAPNSGW